jgi:hypothetical protein
LVLDFAKLFQYLDRWLMDDLSNCEPPITAPKAHKKKGSLSGISAPSPRRYPNPGVPCLNSGSSRTEKPSSCNYPLSLSSESEFTSSVSERTLIDILDGKISAGRTKEELGERDQREVFLGERSVSFDEFTRASNMVEANLEKLSCALERSLQVLVSKRRCHSFFCLCKHCINVGGGL